MSIWSHHNMHARQAVDRPARRSEGDMRAMEAAYRSGQVFLGRLSMPIIDLRHYLEPELNMHHSMQSFSARLRMQRAQAHAGSQLIWSSRRPYTPLAEAFDMLEQWLENMRDNPALPAIEARPADATDRCYDDEGRLIASGETVWNGVWNERDNGACMDAYPIFSNPRIVAGDDYAGVVFKCHLRSVEDAIANDVYAPIDIAPHREELEQIFPDGVCDYSRGDAARPVNILAD
jgi:hypothetical protein